MSGILWLAASRAVSINSFSGIEKLTNIKYFCAENAVDDAIKRINGFKNLAIKMYNFSSSIPSTHTVKEYWVLFFLPPKATCYALMGNNDYHLGLDSPFHSDNVILAVQGNALLRT